MEIRDTYAKHVASLTSGVQYDQAVHPDTLTYAFHNGSPVPLGLRREVKVLRALRADRPTDGPTDLFPDAREDCAPFPHLGNIYRGPIDRTRVTRREVEDVAIWSPTVTTLFDYGIPTVSSDGSEFRGHDVVRATDAYGHYRDTYFHQEDALKGRVREIQQYSAGSLLFTKTRNTWEGVQPHAGVSFARLNQTDVETYDGGATPRITTTRFAYDAYGNRTRTEEDGDTSAAGDERDEEVDWAINTTQWIHRPSRVAVKERTGAAARERWFSYDNLPWGQVGARGVLTQEEFRVTATGGRGAQGNPVVQYGYDAYGNQTSRRGPPTSASPSGCLTTSAFDDDQAFPRVVTTCLGHPTTTVTDQRWGRPLSVQDANLQTTTYLYDEFGRLARVTRPVDAGTPPSHYGTVSYWYVDVGVAGLQRVLAARTEEHGTANHLWTEDFFDGQGRVYFRRAEGPAQGTVIQQETARDARGQVWAQSGPHFGTETAQWTTYLYDPIGRQVAVTRPDGKTAWTAYAPGIVTVTNERGKVRHHFPDGLSRLVAVQEVNDTGTPAPVYTTWYEYTAAGDLRAITNHAGSVTTLTHDALGRRVQVQDPNLGTWDYVYDAAGNLIEQQDAQQPRQVTRFEYDAQDRLRFKRFVGTSSAIEWRYDEPAGQYGVGRVTKVIDLATTTDLRYDANGRVSQVTRLLDGTPYVLTRTYDALDRVRTEGFSPGGGVMSYTYDAAGRVQKIAEGQTEIIKNVTYNARGQRETQEYGNLLWSRWTYHPTTFRVETRKTGTQGTPATVQDLAYTYDATGNVKTIVDGFFTGARTFEYDAVNRLTWASGPFGPGQAMLTQEYAIDGIGNLIRVTTGTAVVDYVYGDLLHASAVTATPQDGRAYTYDLNGDMTTHRAASRPITWTRDYRLATLEVPGGRASFAYDADGLRVRKTWEAGTAYVTRYPFPGYEVAPDGTVTQFLRLNGELVAARRSTGQTYYYHTDHLGSVHVITNAAGQRVQLVEYDPWGRVSRLEGAIDATTRFTGQRLDPETGLMDYGARYYDPELRRFISADPLSPGPGDPQGLNRYAYVLNNPLAYIDPNGREPITAATLGTLAAVGFAFGATSGALTAIQRPGSTGWDVAKAAAVGGVVGAVTAPLASGPWAAMAWGAASYVAIHFAAGGTLSDVSVSAAAASALTAGAANRFVNFVRAAGVSPGLAQVVGGEATLSVDLLAGVVASQVPSTLPGVLPPMDPSWLPFSPIGLDPLRGQPIPGSDGAAVPWRLPMLDPSPSGLFDPLGPRVPFAVPGAMGAPWLSVDAVAISVPTWLSLPTNDGAW